MLTMRELMSIRRRIEVLSKCSREDLAGDRIVLHVNQPGRRGKRRSMQKNVSMLSRERFFPSTMIRDQQRRVRLDSLVLVGRVFPDDVFTMGQTSHAVSGSSGTTDALANLIGEPIDEKHKG